MLGVFIKQTPARYQTRRPVPLEFQAQISRGTMQGGGLLRQLFFHAILFQGKLLTINIFSRPRTPVVTTPSSMKFKKCCQKACRFKSRVVIPILSIKKCIYPLILKGYPCFRRWHVRLSRFLLVSTLSNYFSPFCR